MLNSEEESSLANLILVKEKMYKLPPIQRIVLVLRLCGFTQKECGELLGTTRAAIGYIYKRAIKNIKELIGGQDADT
jgi:transcriptional regulator